MTKAAAPAGIGSVDVGVDANVLRVTIIRPARMNSVNGPAAGVGVSLALACDLTVATESSYFLLAFTKIGLMPDGGASALGAASIGRARALKMGLLAERLPASEALAVGLIADVIADDEFAAGIDAAFTRERSGQLALLAATDFAEGVDTFLGKRPAVFGPPAS